MARLFSVFFVAVFAAAFGYNSAAAFARPLPQSVPTDASGITDPAEYRAYIEALNTDNPYSIDKFVTRYPRSSGLERVLQHGISRYIESSDSILYYWASGEDKVLEFVQRLREIAPDDLRPLAAITTLDAKKVSIGKNELVSEMCSDAQSGLNQLPGWQSPEEMTRSDSNNLRKKMAYTFHLAAGQCAYQNKDFAAARVFFARAVRLYPARLSAVYGLTLSDLQEPINPQGFAYCDKTIQLLKQSDANSRRSANHLASYCQAVSRRVYHTTEVETGGRSAPEKTFPPGPLALDGSNAPKP